jgi:hypothetical protein
MFRVSGTDSPSSDGHKDLRTEHTDRPNDSHACETSRQPAIRRARLLDRFYSLDKVFIGFTFAAFIERELIVMRAIVSVIKSEIINGTTVAHTNGDNPKSIL